MFSILYLVLLFFVICTFAFYNLSIISMLLVCIFIWLWVTAEQKYLAQYFFVFSIFVVLRFYYFFFSCLWSAFSFFNGWQKNRNILRNILLYFRIWYFCNFTISSRACGLHFHLSLCDSGAEIEFARLQRKEKTFKENTGLLLLRNMFFCFIFLHRETILIHSIQISRSNLLTFRFHLICFLILSNFKQAVTSRDAMIPRE